jgi:hypothetical protein
MARLLVAVGIAGVLAVGVGAFVYYVLPPGWGWTAAGLLFVGMLAVGLIVAERERRWQPKPSQRVLVNLGIEGEARGRVIEHHQSGIPQTTVNWGAGPIRVPTGTLTHLTLSALVERWWTKVTERTP